MSYTPGLTDTQLRATPVPVSGTVTVQDGGNVISVDDAGGSLTVDAASLPLPTGAATESTLTGVLTTSDFDTKTGSLTEAAPATDTASSGLNGRLQRIAQRITSLIALVPAALTGSGNFKVSLAESTASQAVTGPLTDTQLRATAVPVSGTVAVSSITTSLPTMSDRTGSAVFSSISGTLSRTVPGCSVAHLDVDGTFVGSIQVTGISTFGQQMLILRSLSDGSYTTTVSSPGLYEVPCAAYNSLSVNASSWTSGSANVAVLASAGAGSSISAVIPGTQSTSLGKAEDSAHASGDTGVMGLGVRNDTRGSLCGTDLDYAPHQLNSSGDVRVEPFSLGAAASLGKLEDAAHTSGDVGVAALAVRNEARQSSGLAGADLDYQLLQMDGAGNTYVRDDRVNRQLQDIQLLLMEIRDTLVEQRG